MPRFVSAILLAVLSATTHAFNIEGRVDIAVAGADLGAGTVSISIIEAGRGTSLLDREAHRPMIPASNLKLFTTGAALHTLGIDFRFVTSMKLDGDRLFIVGGGDPGFGDPDLVALMTVDDQGRRVPLDIETFLDIWPRAITEAGVTELREIVVDDSLFDRELVHPDWPRDQLNRHYCAEVAGLNFHLNRLHFYPEPRSNQRPSLARRTPRTTAIGIDNRATSRRGVHDNDTVWIARRLEENYFTFYGNVKHKYSRPVPVTVHDMPKLFAVILAERLRSAGVPVATTRRIAPDERYEGEPIGAAIFTPIETAITRCNRDSQNLYAESLLKRMGEAKTGQPGSWLNGASIVRHVVHERLGRADLSSLLTVADGSGLSRNNRVAPATITAWLNSFHNDERFGAMFIESLSVGGENGTLRNRLATVDLADSIVQAKSGYINGVSCLSGYVTSPDGRRRCFSVMINNLDVSVGRAKRLQDRIVAIIAEEMKPEPAMLGSD